MSDGYNKDEIEGGMVVAAILVGGTILMLGGLLGLLAWSIYLAVQ